MSQTANTSSLLITDGVSRRKPILGQYDGLSFYRYDHATKKMARCNTGSGFDVEYLDKSYALPRTGKDIIVTTWHEDGKKTQKTLKWNGHGFSY